MKPLRRYTTLDRAQGLNNAVKDASELVDALTAVYKGQKCLEEAVASSEAEMIPLGVNEIRLTQLVSEKRRDMKNNDPMILKGLQKVEY
jgi:2-polyprenyl-6-methoxyphenol hydroxylase-like FAD-dependent oxidoreductase